jgi:Protein of unknown function (DUF3667)
MTQTCKNCNYPTDNKFCPQCGQKTSTSKFTMGVLLHDFIHGFYHVDHGLLFTAKELLLRPGTMLKNYMQGQRVKYYNPFTYILLLGGLSAIFLKQFHWRSLFVDLGIFSNRTIDQEIWISSIKHFSFRLLASIPVYALVSWLFYWRKHFNFSEHLIGNTYLRGQGNLLMIIIAPLALMLPPSTMYVAELKLVAYVGVLIYIGWAYAGWFNDKPTPLRVLKGFLCVLVSSLIELFLLSLFIRK